MNPHASGNQPSVETFAANVERRELLIVIPVYFVKVTTLMMNVKVLNLSLSVSKSY